MAEEQCIREEAAGYRHLLDVNWTEVADHLIKSRLLLTALELHTELLENGREVPSLRDFFSNPGNFEFETVRAPSPVPFNLARTSSNLTLDSIDDFTRYSDDGLAEQGDERIAVLQFELRKAHETIKSLRGSLTIATEQEGPQVSQKDPSETSSMSEDTIKPHEKRALNFLVNEYLLQNGYRLTSVTLSDENEDQDFEDWDDVGLNVPQPPNLLRLYRDFDKHTMASTADSLEKVEERNRKLEEMCRELSEDLVELRKENEEKKENDDKVERELRELTEEKNMLISQVSTLAEQLEESKQLILSSGNVHKQVPSISEENNLTSVKMNVSNITISDDDGEGKGLSNNVENSFSSNDENDRVKNETKELNVAEESSRNNEISEGGIRRVCPAFKKALFNLVGVSHASRVGNEITQLTGTEESSVLVVSRCLPHIVPNVLLNKREELIPLILCTAIHHPEEKERDKLLHSLFNLIKRPDIEQRRMIITGCSAFARVVGHMRTEAELLPQLWEQINHRFFERRQLVAEACGTLAQYLPNEIVSSLLLSMLKQMFTEDRNESVRAAVIKSLALVFTIIESSSKYKEAERLFVQALCDNAEEVRGVTLMFLLPTIAVWAHELDKLQSDLVELILQQLELTLSDFLHIEETREEETELESTMNIISSRFCLYIRALTQCLPSLLTDILARAPFQSECNELEEKVMLPESRVEDSACPLTNVTVLFGGAGRHANFMESFDRWLEKQDSKTFWESLEWISNKCMSRIYDIVCRIHCNQVEWIDEFTRFFRQFCSVFGKVFTETRLLPYFDNELKAIFDEDTSVLSDVQTEQVISSAVIPVYILGILTTSNDNKERIKLFIKDTLTFFATRQSNSSSMFLVCEKLSSDDIWCEVLLETMWGLLTHVEANVRCVVPRLLQTMIKNLDKTSIMKRVLPALVTISTDNDKSVRISTVPAFGAIVEHISDDEMLEKIHIQFQSFLSDPSYYHQHELQVALIRTFGKIGPHSEPRFRDDFLHPKLTELVLRNAKTEDETKKTEVCIALLEAYASLTCCFISEDIIRNNTLPGLMYLKQDLAILAPEYEETAGVLMKDCEDKLVNQKNSGSLQMTTKGQTAEEMKRAILNKFYQLKDASSKTKMPDLFRKKHKSDSNKST